MVYKNFEEINVMCLLNQLSAAILLACFTIPFQVHMGFYILHSESRQQTHLKVILLIKLSHENFTTWDLHDPKKGMMKNSD